MSFALIAEHRGIWPAAWLCEALDVSRSGFQPSLSRKPSQRSMEDEEIGAKVRASFIGSARTFGTRRVWRDVLAEGIDCRLNRIEHRDSPLLHGLGVTKPFVQSVTGGG